MAIASKSIKIRWSSSGGRCAFPSCWERLCIHDAKESAPYTLGEMAHICGEKVGSNRHDNRQTAIDRDDYKNLILLCPNHHTVIDRRENEVEYTVAKLLAMKDEHEKRVRKRLDAGTVLTRLGLAQRIVPMLEENKQSWTQYGPSSEMAKNNPIMINCMPFGKQKNSR